MQFFLNCVRAISGASEQAGFAPSGDICGGRKITQEPTSEVRQSPVANTVWREKGQPAGKLFKKPCRSHFLARSREYKVVGISCQGNGMKLL